MPGVTTVHDANTRLTQVYGRLATLIPDGAVLQDVNGSVYLVIGFFSLSSDDVIREIRLTRTREGRAVSVGDVFQVIDRPDAVSIATTSAQVTNITRFESLPPVRGVNIYVRQAQPYLDLNAPITGMTFFNLSGSNWTLADGLTWHGFAALTKYGLSP